MGKFSEPVAKLVFYQLLVAVKVRPQLMASAVNSVHVICNFVTPVSSRQRHYTQGSEGVLHSVHTCVLLGFTPPSLSLSPILCSLFLCLPPSPSSHPPLLPSLPPFVAGECSPSHRRGRDSDKSHRLWPVQSRWRELTDEDTLWYPQLPRTGDTQDGRNGGIWEGCRLLEHGCHSLYHVSKSEIAIRESILPLPLSFNLPHHPFLLPPPLLPPPSSLITGLGATLPSQMKSPSTHFMTRSAKGVTPSPQSSGRMSLMMPLISSSSC